MLPNNLLIYYDNNTDNTVEIENILLSKTDIDYKIINNKSSVGVADNWNNAIINTSGQNIKMLFQDDFLYPNCLGKMARLATIKRIRIDLFS